MPGTTRHGLENSTYNTRAIECADFAEELVAKGFVAESFADVKDEATYQKIVDAYGGEDSEWAPHLDRLTYIYKAQTRFYEMLDAWRDGDIETVRHTEPCLHNELDAACATLIFASPAASVLAAPSCPGASARTQGCVAGAGGSVRIFTVLVHVCELSADGSVTGGNAKLGSFLVPRRFILWVLTVARW